MTEKINSELDAEQFSCECDRLRESHSYLVNQEIKRTNRDILLSKQLIRLMTSGGMLYLFTMIIMTFS
ncbi:hypothetical protein [Endozoicomonas lisbonensis]|uniref:SMODS and SLOG-associating 2TM effector domain-containing protein n=1 Tax=Endozoicomonas lisbonensis TaxID=3120522 RepID=A0ABV2SN11_9GAMM